jgi:histidyl-tRNA synthetase
VNRRTFNAPVGTRDVLPPESARFAGVVAAFSAHARRAGFGLVVNPIFEDVEVFSRGMGEDTEIARKEMYVFEDRGGRRLALRPEGTASVVRAFVQHHPTLPWKVWYLTPALRYERPQAGRYRQHHQLGVEALGSEDPLLDVEVIALAWKFYEALGMTRVELLVNSMGHDGCRATYTELLSEHLRTHETELCDEHRIEWKRNPMRVFDCKRDECQKVTSTAPLLADHLCEPCRDHFTVVREGLTALEISFTLAPRLVRGFDYYTRTVFEYVSHGLDAAQNAVGGGGRYDKLAAELGGDDVGGVGFGSGVERILLTLDGEGIPPEYGAPTEIFIVDTTGTTAGLVLAERLRDSGVRCERGYDGRSLKAQMKLADRSGARYALLLGPRELADGTVTMRDLRGAEGDERQRSIATADVVTEVHALRHATS